MHTHTYLKLRQLIGLIKVKKMNLKNLVLLAFLLLPHIIGMLLFNLQDEITFKFHVVLLPHIMGMLLFDGNIRLKERYGKKLHPRIIGMLLF